MASRIIDEFKVKHGGLFHVWRYAQVLVDDNGTITWRAKPGKPVIDSDCTTSFKYVTRSYKESQLITEFCNLDTFTNYRIYAQPCKPFAYVETDLNAEKCGYQAPLDNPADPPNPFGTLIYRPYKYTEFCDHFGNNCRVDILRKYNYSQPQTSIQVDSFVKESLPPVRVVVNVDRIKHTVSFTGQAQNDSNTNRVYAPDELITDICDFNTGTNLKVYAKSAVPFAYIVEETDALSCQIPTTIPDYIENWGSPVIMDYKTDGDNKNPTFAPCEVTLNLLSGPNFSLQDLYTEDEREFQVVITREDLVIFKGYLIPDSCQEPFIKAPYEVSIKATDGIGALKTVTYTLPVTTDLKVRQRFIDILAFALAPTNLNLNIRTVCNVYETVMNNSMDDDPLAQASVSPLRLAGENGNIKNCYEVLEEICKIFKACLFQANGEWRFERRSEYAKEKIRSRLYNDKAFFLYSEQLEAIRTLGNFDHDDIQIYDPQPDLYRGNAYKRVEVLSVYGDVPSLIFNGNFEQWDGQNFQSWSKYGGIKVDRTQKYISGKGYAPIAIDDYALFFNERAQSGKWVESNPIAVLRDDQLALNFDLFAAHTSIALKFRVKIGSYYLTNDINQGNYHWVQTLATATTNTLSERTLTIKISLPDIPEDGVMILQLYGPQHYKFQTSDRGPGGGTNINRTPPEETDEYVGLAIDNVSISKQSKSDQKSPIGILNISEQSGYYTKRPDRLEIIYFDYSSDRSTFLIKQQIQTGSVIVPRRGGEPGDIDPSMINDDLYAIFTADESYSESWYEYESSSGRVPIGLLLAKSILKDYQKPYWYASGNYIGNNLVYNNSLRFELDCEPEFSKKIFSLLSCTFDVKSCTMTNVNMTELFDKFVKSTDIKVPSYPGDISPPFINNPNSPPSIPTTGIFTDEFTPEFL